MSHRQPTWSRILPRVYLWFRRSLEHNRTHRVSQGRNLHLPSSFPSAHNSAIGCPCRYPAKLVSFIRVWWYYPKKACQAFGAPQLGLYLMCPRSSQNRYTPAIFLPMTYRASTTNSPPLPVWASRWSFPWPLNLIQFCQCPPHTSQPNGQPQSRKLRAAP